MKWALLPLVTIRWHFRLLIQWQMLILRNMWSVWTTFWCIHPKESNTSNFSWVAPGLYIWFIDNKRAWPWLFPVTVLLLWETNSGGCCLHRVGCECRNQTQIWICSSSYEKAPLAWVWRLGFIGYVPAWCDPRHAAKLLLLSAYLFLQNATVLLKNSNFWNNLSASSWNFFILDNLFMLILKILTDCGERKGFLFHMENDWRVCTKLRLACWNINRFVTLLVSELIHAKLRRKQLGVGWEASRCVRGCSECWAGMVSALWHAYWQLDSHLLGKLAASTDYRTTIVEHVLHLLHWAYEGHLAFNSASLQSITDGLWHQDVWLMAGSPAKGMQRALNGSGNLRKGNSWINGHALGYPLLVPCCSCCLKSRVRADFDDT